MTEILTTHCAELSKQTLSNYPTLGVRSAIVGVRHAVKKPGNGIASYEIFLLGNNN